MNYSPRLLLNRITSHGVDLDGNTPIIVEAFTRNGRIAYRKVSSDNSTRKTIVASCMLQRESFTRWITIPLAAPRKAIRVVSTLLDIQLPFALDKCEYSVVLVVGNRDSKSTSALVAGARHSEIASRLHLLSAAGFSPHVMDQEGIALWSQLIEEEPQVTSANVTAVLFFFASNRTTISIGQNGRFVAAHSVNSPDVSMLQRILRPYLASPTRSLMAFRSGPSALTVCTPLFLSDLCSSLQISEPQAVRDPESFLARACARRALMGDAYQLNLRSGKFQIEEHKLQASRRARHTAVVLLLAGLALCTSSAFWIWAENRRSAELQGVSRQLAESIVGNPKLAPPGQELLAAQRSIEEQKTIYAPLLAPFEPPLSDVLQRALSSALQNGANVESMTFNGISVILHGQAPDWAACERLSVALREPAWTTRLERKDAPSMASRPAFVLRMTRIP